MRLHARTLLERILTMTTDELEQFAESEALAMADSSKLEGLVLDQEHIRMALLDGYRDIRTATHLQSNTHDQ
jgi:hypothetical protein